MEKNNDISLRFAHFYRRVRIAPGATLSDLETAWATIGIVVEKFLTGGTKRELLREMEWTARTIQAKQRFFYILHPKDLEECLYWVTHDRSYAKQERAHEVEHCTLFTNFRPRNGDSPPEALFGIFVTCGGVVVPYTIAACRVFPFTIWPFSRLGSGLLFSTKRDPNVLFRNWKEETIRQFYLHLKKNVKDRSRGDQLILGK